MFITCDSSRCGKNCFMSDIKPSPRWVNGLFSYKNISASQFAPKLQTFALLARRFHLRFISRIHLFKSSTSQLLTVHTMSHCPRLQTSHCLWDAATRGPGCQHQQYGSGSLCLATGAGQRGKVGVQRRAAIKGVSSVNGFVYSRKRASFPIGALIIVDVPCAERRAC